ncbi:hypothetical protein L0F63_003821 [Massospora cicadina]|nr:hypothetical protein L0F63_003821 [Massospora cicadina]
MFYPVQEFDYYRDANNAPIIQDAALICVGLQLVLGTFSAYIFWVLIIVIALAFSQLMSLSKYIHILNAPNDPEVVTYTMEPDWTAPPPPPTYSRATAIPPAYESPKVSSPNLPTSQLPSSSSNPNG